MIAHTASVLDCPKQELGKSDRVAAVSSILLKTRSSLQGLTLVDRHVPPRLRSSTKTLPPQGLHSGEDFFASTALSMFIKPLFLSMWSVGTLNTTPIYARDPHQSSRSLKHHPLPGRTGRDGLPPLGNVGLGGVIEESRVHLLNHSAKRQVEEIDSAEFLLTCKENG